MGPGYDDRPAVQGRELVERQHNVDRRQIALHVSRKITVKRALEYFTRAFPLRRQDEPILKMQNRRVAQRLIHDRKHRGGA